MGIGLHNFGEGLALGASYAAVTHGLTGVLVVGFALHNGTEGMRITGPISSLPMKLKEPALMGFLAGFPTILGSVVGSLVYSQLVGALFFSAAAGAILYVIIELLRITHAGPTGSRAAIALLVGILLMYFTELIFSLG
jgi:ZIP family zinc transporter